MLFYIRESLDRAFAIETRIEHTKVQHEHDVVEEMLINGR